MSRIRAQMESIARKHDAAQRAELRRSARSSRPSKISPRSRTCSRSMRRSKRPRPASTGKGFGVVAQEVKSLAEQSRQATDRVRAILSDIQKATTAAVMATEQGSKAVEAGRTADRGRGRIDPALMRQRDRSRAGRDADRGIEPAAARRHGPGGRRDGEHQAGQHAECREREAARDRRAQSQRPRPAPEAAGRALRGV